MNHSLILKVGAVLCAAFGLALVFGPNQLVAAYGAEALNPPGTYNSMLYGSTLLGIAVMNWAASTASADDARLVVFGNFVMSTLSGLVALVRQLTSPDAQEMGWINVVLLVALAAAYGYLHFTGRTVERRHGAGGVGAS